MGHSKITVTFGELEKAGLNMSPQSSFSSPVWPIKKCNGTWPIIIDYRKLYKATLPINAMVPSIVLLLEKMMASIKTSLYPGPISQFVQHSIRMNPKTNLPLHGVEDRKSHRHCPKGIFIFPPLVTGW